MSEDLRSRLNQIRAERGKLTPAVVAEEAEPLDDPLHHHFDWDNDIAGPKWRLHQAHELIQSVKVVYRDKAGQPADVRAFHAIRGDDGWRYEPAEEIVQDPLATKILLADMEREWRTLKRRYDKFDEFRVMVRRDLGETG